MSKKVKQISLRDDSESNREIKKHSSIVQLGGLATLLERKLINAAIWITKDQLKRNPNEVRFSAEIGLFKRLLGYKDTKNDDLKECLRNLRRTEFEYNIMHKDGERWGNFSYFSDVEIESWGRGRTTHITREYPSRILKVIQNPKMFVRLNLLIIMGLDSKHSVVLYEFLKDYVGIGKYTIHINDFRNLMGIENGQYNSFSMLKQRVIDTAIAEIVEKTDLDVSYEVERIGRKVNSLLFKMRLKKHRLDLFPNSEKIKKKLQYFGLKEKKINELLKVHDQQYLQANIEVVEQEAKKGSIKKLSAYLLKAFQDDYRPQESEFAKVEAQKITERTAQETEEKEIQEAQKQRLRAFNKWRKETTVQRFSEMQNEEKEALKNAFLKEVENVDYIANVLKSKGFENIIIQ